MVQALGRTTGSGDCVLLCTLMALRNGMFARSAGSTRYRGLWRMTRATAAAARYQLTDGLAAPHQR